MKNNTYFLYSFVLNLMNTKQIRMRIGVIINADIIAFLSISKSILDSLRDYEFYSTIVQLLISI